MATYIRLTDYKSSDEKEQEFFNSENRYEAKQKDFSKIPTSPIAYWVSNRVKEIFQYSEKIGNITEPRQGLATADNDTFLRLWNEINFNKLGLKYQSTEDTQDKLFKWFPYNKGGQFQKWYGNLDFVVNWWNDGYDIKTDKLTKLKNGLCLESNSKPKNTQYYFREAVTWTDISTSSFGARIQPQGCVFDVSGSCLFSNDTIYYLSFMNSKLNFYFLKLLNPTLHFQVGNIKSIPIVFPNSKEIKQKIETIAQENIDISKEEWDSRETSWDFTKNELIKHKSDSKIETAYINYCNYWKEKFNTLHQNEEELNRLFIDIYELQDELTPDVELKDITILKNEAKIVDNELVFQSDEIMKQFISYGVAVMFGRYSLDSDGLLIANMGQEVPTSTTFEIDDDNVIPVLEDDYFKDDIASRFVQFVKSTFGEEDLSENIRFIESSLGTTLRKYFVKGFYEDHIKRYKKRPIYWMVASPKKGFMSLIYMHRYEADTFARVRNSYLTEYIAKLEAHKETLALTTSSDTASDKDKKDADKQMKNIDTKLKEIIEFDRDKMMSWSQNPTEIDLDDGVKVNYCRFRDILYPITGLCK
jgi:hypothetical protein